MNEKEKKNLPIRSSAAEYLTFVAATGECGDGMEMRYEDENIWLTQISRQVFRSIFTLISF